MDKDLQKIKELIREGKVETADDVNLINQPDGDIVIREVEMWRSGFRVSWSKPGTGFGEFVIYKQDGVLKCHDEYMGREFVLECMKALFKDIPFDKDE